MAFDVFVAQYAMGIYTLKDRAKVVEARVELSQSGWPKLMCLGPMRAPAMSSKNLFESAEKRAIRDIKPIRPVRRESISKKTYPHILEKIAEIEGGKHDNSTNRRADIRSHGVQGAEQRKICGRNRQNPLVLHNTDPARALTV